MVLDNQVIDRTSEDAGIRSLVVNKAYSVVRKCHALLCLLDLASVGHIKERFIKQSVYFFDCLACSIPQ